MDFTKERLEEILSDANPELARYVKSLQAEISTFKAAFIMSEETIELLVTERNELRIRVREELLPLLREKERENEHL